MTSRIYKTLNIIPSFGVVIKGVVITALKSKRMEVVIL